MPHSKIFPPPSDSGRRTLDDGLEMHLSFSADPPGKGGSSLPPAAEKPATIPAANTAPSLNPSSVLLIPGWRNSRPAHWQSHWERELGFRRVIQDNWNVPDPVVWRQRLDETVSNTPPPVVLVGSELGSNLIISWAQHSAHTHLVSAVMLVTPMDLERSHLAFISTLGWLPVSRQRLPFRSLLVGRRNDPNCAEVRARGLAMNWGSRYLDAGDFGNIDIESGLGAWPQGREWLNELLASAHLALPQPSGKNPSPLP